MARSARTTAAALTGAERRTLRVRVERALLAELERVGPEALSRAAVLRRFEGRGVDRATLFRWAADLFASGRAGQHLAGRIGAAAERRAERVPEAPAADAARAAVQLLPAPVRPEDIAGGGSAVVVIGRQQECICAALEVMGRARAEGKVRNAKLLLPRRPRS